MLLISSAHSFEKPGQAADRLTDPGLSAPDVAEATLVSRGAEYSSGEGLDWMANQPSHVQLGDNCVECAAADLTSVQSRHFTVIELV